MLHITVKTENRKMKKKNRKVNIFLDIKNAFVYLSIQSYTFQLSNLHFHAGGKITFKLKLLLSTWKIVVVLGNQK